MNGKCSGIALVLFLSCAVHNSNGMKKGCSVESDPNVVKGDLDSIKFAFDVRVPSKDVPLKSNVKYAHLMGAKRKNSDLPIATLLKIITGTVKKLDLGRLNPVFKFVDEAGDINIGSRLINDSDSKWSYITATIPAILKYNKLRGNVKNYIASLVVVGGGRLLGEIPVRGLGERYDDFFKNFQGGYLKPVGNLLKKGLKSLAVIQTTRGFDILTKAFSAWLGESDAKKYSFIDE